MTSTASLAIPPEATVVPALSIKNVGKSFRVHSGGRVFQRDVVRDVNIEIADKSFTTIVGTSGCGKSTLLSLCSGILEPTSGEIRVFGKLVRGVTQDVGFVTQDANLLPWLRVVENVELPLKFRGVGRKERREQALEWLDRVGLADSSNLFPGQLSGGMRKRCSIVRTLIYNPKVVLMDEPFGALDAMTKLALQEELLELWERDKRTVLFVTHDLNEAITLSDQVAIMSRKDQTITDVVKVPLERPRSVEAINTNDVAREIFSRLWSSLRQEMHVD